MEISAVGVKVGFEIVKRTAPKGLAWVTMQLTGKDILIIGPGDAGKTRISEYLSFGELEEEEEHVKTLDIEKRPAFEISLGRDETLKLKVRKSYDVPGQTGSVHHANIVGEKKPHTLIIVLDASTSAQKLEEYLKELCVRLSYLLLKDSKARARLSTIIVALNKRDKVSRKAHFDARKKKISKCLMDGLQGVLGEQRCKAIPVLPTIAVNTPAGSAMIDRLVREIAKSAC